MRENKTKPLALLAAVMAVLLAVSGCGSSDSGAVPEEQGPQAIEVHTTTADYGTIDRQTQFVGRVEAAESVKVYATTSAKVIQANAAPGERVEKGQLLFALDTENLEIMAETARLQYEASLSGADMSITSAKKAYDNAKENYADLYENRYDLGQARDIAYTYQKQLKAAADAANKALEDYYQKCADNGVEINKETDANYLRLQKAVDDAAYAYQQAKAAYDQLNAQYDQLDETVDSLRDNISTLRDTYRNTAGDEEAGIVGTVQSQVDLAKISYDNAVKNLNDARVYAPVSGIVSAKNISVSDFASPGMPLYVIEPEGDAPMVSFNLSEDGANALSVGSPVMVIYSGAEYPARITELANTASLQTGLYAAKAQTDEPLPTSRSGGVVKVQASTAKAENALLLSLDLLEYDGNQPYVYVYRDGTAVRVDVVTGISSADDVVILSGITEKDQIITTWHPDLKDGAAVTLAE